MDSDQGSVLSKVLLSLGLVVLLALAFLIPYLVLQHKVNDLNNQISSLKSQIGKLSPSPAGKSQQSKNYAHTSIKGVQITVFDPLSNSKVSSAVGVIGEVPGSWSFEASFPIKLEDNKGSVIAQTAAHVLGNWMTTELVPFSAQLTFSSPPSGNGVLVLEKDNPSGLKQNDDSVAIPVTFG
jgi:hypothetical protein